MKPTVHEVAGIVAAPYAAAVEAAAIASMGSLWVKTNKPQRTFSFAKAANRRNDLSNMRGNLEAVFS